ncbi:hypothetical protein IFDJLNFL_2956 [Methylobacterium dankookense]|uniref:Uncharacterized protein n=1 Tax=Methylobacterium dankookense TaxID=560405 RepID=A0ABQ4RIC3_9HYPH|nr:hypothetical protein IFDJLNFL_2956 [Methylobacterium dankookense]
MVPRSQIEPPEKLVVCSMEIRAERGAVRWGVRIAASACSGV